MSNGTGGHWEGEVWVPDDPKKFGVQSDDSNWFESIPWWAWVLLGLVARDVISSRAAK